MAVYLYSSRLIVLFRRLVTQVLRGRCGLFRVLYGGVVVYSIILRFLMALLGGLSAFFPFSGGLSMLTSYNLEPGLRVMDCVQC